MIFRNKFDASPQVGLELFAAVMETCVEGRWDDVEFFYFLLTVRGFGHCGHRRQQSAKPALDEAGQSLDV